MVSDNFSSDDNVPDSAELINAVNKRASICSHENFDAGASPNIGAKQLSKLQSVNPLSNQHILKGSRMEEKRKLEARKLF